MRELIAGLLFWLMIATGLLAPWLDVRLGGPEWSWFAVPLMIGAVILINHLRSLQRTAPARGSAAPNAGLAGAGAADTAANSR
jgi:hypothetical protein